MISSLSVQWRIVPWAQHVDCVVLSLLFDLWHMVAHDIFGSKPAQVCQVIRVKGFQRINCSHSNGSTVNTGVDVLYYFFVDVLFIFEALNVDNGWEKELLLLEVGQLREGFDGGVVVRLLPAVNGYVFDDIRSSKFHFHRILLIADIISMRLKARHIDLCIIFLSSLRFLQPIESGLPFILFHNYRQFYSLFKVYNRIWPFMLQV
jgi:hypothetical protein